MHRIGASTKAITQHSAGVTSAQASARVSPASRSQWCSNARRSSPPGGNDQRIGNDAALSLRSDKHRIEVDFADRVAMRESKAATRSMHSTSAPMSHFGAPR